MSTKALCVWNRAIVPALAVLMMVLFSLEAAAFLAEPVDAWCL